MTIPVKTLKNGFIMPVYGLGTWGIGGTYTRVTGNESTDVAAIKDAIDQGITHIDTAESYAAGYSEELIGKAIKEYDRKKLFLVSKVHLEHLGYDDLIRSTKASLQRLGTDYLDMCLTHRFSLTVPVKETMRAMDTLVDEGLVKHIGVSNYNAIEMQEAQSYAKHKLVANQVHYNLKIREVEHKGVLKYCQENDMLLIAWRPLQKGLLLNDPGSLVEALCKKYNKTPTQLALNWLISQDNVVTLSKTTTLAHLTENLGAIGWTMDQEDIEKLRNEYPGQETISDTVPLH